MAYSSEAPGVIKPSLRLQHYGKTHLNGYFRSLLLANAVQAFGTVLNFKWAADGGATEGPFCSAQGGIKHAGNIATAIWAFVLALHLFNLLFLRLQSTKFGFWCTIAGGWAVVVLIVVIGPAAIQTPAKGPYYGVSGAWCWITSNYPRERILLEYFLEYVSAVLCIVLYTFVILRLRGNLVCQDGRWTLRFVPRGESWQLSLGRDLIDSAMLRAAQRMIFYTLLLLPISLDRLSWFAGANVPFWATVVADMIFNLTGFVNVLLLIAARRIFPDAQTLPEFSTTRKTVHKSLFNAGGVIPFTIDRSEMAEHFEALRLERAESARSSRRSSVDLAKPTQ
ncbi:hypothetical protein B0H17DRAFT_1163434 [Mycena rosella]|uniref:Glucose receptor Git3 N-terminal domain-containing protein n=1 Tax=Mycena rosella TaxID=1033263 RepID=A0AAD7CNP8_MYCRO|nr:hypothetical protein B0H17DRAFT_1163434 [Mycena rosella]